MHFILIRGLLIAYRMQYMNMDASVGDIGTANTMEIDLVSKYLNPSLRMRTVTLQD